MLIDPDAFEGCFVRWAQSLTGKLEREVVAIDGKTVRRSGSRRHDHGPLHLVSAWPEFAVHRHTRPADRPEPLSRLALSRAAARALGTRLVSPRDPRRRSSWRGRSWPAPNRARATRPRPWLPTHPPHPGWHGDERWRGHRHTRTTRTHASAGTASHVPRPRGGKALSDKDDASGRSPSLDTRLRMASMGATIPGPLRINGLGIRVAMQRERGQRLE